jgi:hypothetical protein
MADYMEIAHLRVNRAWEHIEQFKLEADSFLKTDPYRVIPQVNAQGSGYVIRYFFKVDRQPPIRLSLLAGDAIHNLRSVIDNLIWNLGQISGESPKSELAFPVSLDENRFKEKILPRYKRLPLDAQALIESLQPYNRKDNPEGHLLYILNRLWNDDKHETPPIVAGVHSSTGIGARGRVIIRSGKVSTGATDDGAEVMIFSVPDRQSVNNLKPVFKVSVAFDKNGPARGVTAYKLLIDLHNFVRDEVVNKFAPFFST